MSNGASSARPRNSRLAWITGVFGIVVGIFGLFGWRLHWFDHEPDRIEIKAVACARELDRAHDILRDESPLDPPPSPGTAFTPSFDLPGRVDLTLTWINAVPITQAAVAVDGVYGARDAGDYFIDHTMPAAAPGQCWNWYHYEPRDDAQPKKVYVRVAGLWPGQRYCFYSAYRIEAGYSKPTDISCTIAPWRTSWGTPARPPAK